VIVFPLPVTVPTVPFPFVTPSTVHVTAVLLAPETVAVMATDVETSIVVEAGLKVTEVGAGANTLMTLEAATPALATLVAFTV
jgi:hypothetical protein